ncbi:helix-turn-helix transcriptional regulator [Paenibacillus cellulositrophicus]|uniref:Transcriptional regulator n=3 Tax=Paenibacillus TaxID=44249 RepID=A0A1R1F1Y6_9BACL|nr:MULTISPECIES: helix-turn-helix transcriptional regulator [Paenibacillus]MBJ9987097.1 helix-turn-helix domain-containing protein [Paenibacillus sp. S28]MCM2997785.1 helix-turn-helix transcriptional regulator [Paenibacillus cellulositrophicus]MEC0173672.1 helix-turn-helix transcriptional regulator [Paenibacillus favisporus]OMF58118.1 transcriptional regulator [Paenibacillus rhizosphaerae]RED41037.1 helix-turn-helix protein [Paenibacillus sp. VMFN-D1]
METTHQRTSQLAEFLQTRRARLTPEQAGLPGGGRRRTPGLRRAEVALLAGVSVDWYTWLEQGRDISVSTQVLESIARALQLDENETKHLFLLASRLLPFHYQQPEMAISPLLQTFLDEQGEHPAFVANSRWDIVGWNRAARLVFGDYEQMTVRERNSVWRMFVSPYTKELLGEGWEKNARLRLAQFRAGYGLNVEDPWWSGMIEDLNKESEEFRAWWPQHDVLNVKEGRKKIYHPRVGLLEFSHITFQVEDSYDLRATVNLPYNDETIQRMKQLLQ